MHGIKAGTCLLRGENIVTYDESVRVGAMEVGEEGVERCLLFVGARVGRVALHVESSFVADADGVGVVIGAVGSDG